MLVNKNISKLDIGRQKLLDEKYEKEFGYEIMRSKMNISQKYSYYKP